MNTFDYINNKVVGYVNISPSSYSNNVNIEVVGYCDYHDNFYELSESEALKIFSPRGNVFAHNFTERHPDKNKKLVCIGVKQNEKEGGGNWDDYIWNKSVDVEEFAYPITKIKGNLTDDGDKNFDVLVENDMYETDEDHFILSNDKVIHINSEYINDTVPYWNSLNLKIITHNVGTFVPVTSLPDYDGYIDVLSNDKLIDWYINKILKKKWSEILKEQNFKFIEPYIKDTIKTIEDIDYSILESRFNRLKRINKSFVLTLEELRNLSEIPWLTNTIDITIDKYKKEYISSVVAENEDEIKKLEEQKESIISSIENHKNELEILEQEIENNNEILIDTESKLDDLEKRKETIVNDMSKVKDLLGISNDVSSASNIQLNFAMQKISLVDNEMPFYHAYLKALENTFKINNIGHEESSTIGKQIAVNNMLLVPDEAVAKAIILSAGKCYYMIEYVSASWKSFDDLWENGLKYVIEQCDKNPDVVHFLVLQNINLTYIPNYLQPLIDIQNGVTDCFNQYDVSFPSNLRILCTITGDEVIPLNKKSLKSMGCINPEIIKDDYLYRIIPGNNDNIGCLSTKLLADAKREYKLKDIPNYYMAYINE